MNRLPCGPEERIWERFRDRDDLSSGVIYEVNPEVESTSSLAPLGVMKCSLVSTIN